MKRRRRRDRKGAIIRAIEAQGDRIIATIREASAEQKASREEMGASVLRQGTGFLRAALDDAAPRTMVVHPGGDDHPRTITLEPKPANDAPEGPPESGPRK